MGAGAGACFGRRLLTLDAEPVGALDALERQRETAPTPTGTPGSAALAEVRHGAERERPQGLDGDESTTPSAPDSRSRTPFLGEAGGLALQPDQASTGAAYGFGHAGVAPAFIVAPAENGDANGAARSPFPPWGGEGRVGVFSFSPRMPRSWRAGRALCIAPWSGVQRAARRVSEELSQQAVQERPGRRRWP